MYMKLSLEVDGKDVILFIVRNNETDYARLAKCLLSYLTDDQLINLIHVSGNKNIIFFNELIEQYKFIGFSSKDVGKCICGVHISNQYLIKNKESNCEYVVGSVCKDNWYAKDCVSYYCQFCFRKKANKENCLDCQGKKDLKEIFYRMKKLLTDKVDFGMYKNKMTYYKMTYKYPSYCNWLLHESNIKEQKKEKIRRLSPND